MIYKQCPFESNVITELFKKIQNEEPTYRPQKNSQLTFEVSPQMKDLLKKILVKNPENRLSI
jgi:serine/threonine protein kinase